MPLDTLWQYFQLAQDAQNAWNELGKQKEILLFTEGF